MTILKEQEKVAAELRQVITIFATSDCQIRPHFILTGPSGSGKSHLIEVLALETGLNFMEINAAQLTKEGTSGNSLSKALSPLLNYAGRPTICFVDEFDKLFISGNSNSQLAHETTTGVQNEFLRVLESDTSSVYGDFGKYVEAPTDNVLFVFAGAFNGAEDINIDKLRDFGVKTEFLGRAGLVFNTSPLSLESLKNVLNGSELLDKYLQLFDSVKRKDVVTKLSAKLEEIFDNNTLGIRAVNNLIHQYFIKGSNFDAAAVKQVTFSKKLALN